MARRWYIVEKEEEVKIFDVANKLIKIFIVKEDLQKAREFLVTFNQVKDSKGKFLYNNFLYQNISLWSFHQEIIFWHYFRYFSKYENVYQFIYEQNISVSLEDSQISSELKKIISALTVVDKNDFKFATFINKLIALSLKSFAWCISYFAIFKLKLNKNLPLVYSPDRYSESGCDFRIYPLYKYLYEHQKDYVEIFHTTWGGSFIRNLLKRKRLAIYLESLVWFPKKIKHDASDVDLRLYPQHVAKFFEYLVGEMVERMGSSLALIIKLEKLLSLVSVLNVVALDDLRYTNELIVACRKNKIKIFALQHGQFTKYHVGWMNYGLPAEKSVTFDKLFVWNDFWKKVLLTYSSQYNSKNVVVGGWLRRLPEFNFKNKTSIPVNNEQIVILVPYEIALAKDAIKKYVRRFFDLGIKIYFKIRPDVDRTEQLRDYGFEDYDDLVIVEKIDAEILSRVDAVAGVYSTFLSEMVYYEKPVFQLSCSFDLGHYLKDYSLATQLPLNFGRDEIVRMIAEHKSLRSIVWPESQNINILFKELLS